MIGYTTLIVPFDPQRVISKEGKDRELNFDEIVEKLRSHWASRTTLEVIHSSAGQQKKSKNGRSKGQSPIDQSHLIQTEILDNLALCCHADPDPEARLTRELKEIAEQENFNFQHAEYYENSKLYVRTCHAERVALFPALSHGDQSKKGSITLFRQALEKDLQEHLDIIGLAEYDPPKSLSRMWRLDPPQRGHIDRYSVADVLRGQMFSFRADIQAMTQWGLSTLRLCSNQSSGRQKELEVRLDRALVTVTPWLSGELALTFSFDLESPSADKEQSEQLKDLFNQVHSTIYALTRSAGPLHSIEQSDEHDARAAAEFVFKAVHPWINSEELPEHAELANVSELYRLRAERAGLSPLFSSKDGFTLWTLCRWLLAPSDTKAKQLIDYLRYPLIRQNKIFHLTSIQLGKGTFTRLQLESSLEETELQETLLRIAKGTRKGKIEPGHRDVRWLAKMRACLTRNGAIAVQTYGNEPDKALGLFQKGYLLLTLHVFAERAALRNQIDQAHAKVWHLKSRGSNARMSDLDDVTEQDVAEVSHLIEELIALRLCFSSASAGSREHAMWLDWLEEHFDILALRGDAEDTTRDLSALIQSYQQRKDLRIERLISRIALIITPFALLSGLMGMNNFRGDIFTKDPEEPLNVFEILLSYIGFPAILMMSALIGLGLLIRVTPWELVSRTESSWQHRLLNHSVSQFIHRHFSVKDWPLELSSFFGAITLERGEEHSLKKSLFYTPAYALLVCGAHLPIILFSIDQHSPWVIFPLLALPSLFARGRWILALALTGLLYFFVLSFNQH